MAAAPEITDTQQVKVISSIDASQVRNKKTPPSVRRKCSVTMAFFWQGALLLSLAAAVSVYAGDTPAMCYLLTGDFWAATWALCVLSLTEMKLDCGPDSVTLVWTDSRAQADTSLFRLGSCLPTRVSVREAVFSVDINDCNFSRMVSEGVNYEKKQKGSTCMLQRVHFCCLTFFLCLTIGAPGQEFSAVYQPCAISHRLLGTISCTPMIWPMLPLLILPSHSRLSVHMRGGYSTVLQYSN